MNRFLTLSIFALALASCGGLSAGGDAGGDDAGGGGPPPKPLPVTLADRPGASGGEALFVEKCMMCHGDGGMGTGLLARRMDMAQARLEDRTDLTADYVIQAARMGIGNMPAIPRGEVSDDQLAQIAAYLGKGTSQ